MLLNSSSEPVRMIDIAREVGVSRPLVSAVLSGGGHSRVRVSAETARRIREVAEKYHFRPNLMARALHGKKSMKIGVLVDTHASQCIYRLLWALEDAIVQGGYRMMLGQTHDDPCGIFRCYEDFLQHGIDGTICLCHEYPGMGDEIRSFFQHSGNIVYYDPPGWDAPHVSIDRRKGTREALMHLKAGGRERIGLWIPEPTEYFSCLQRIEEFRLFESRSELIFRHSDLADFLEKIRLHHLDAVLAENDTYAARLTSALLTRGIRVPEDVAVVGYNNDDFSEFFYPSLSTVDLGSEAAGRALFSLMMKVIEHESEFQNTTVESVFIARQSSALRAV